MNYYNVFSLFKEATFFLIGVESAKSVLDVGQGEEATSCCSPCGTHTLCLNIMRFTNIISKIYTSAGIISPISQIKMLPGKGWGKGRILNV